MEVGEVQAWNMAYDAATAGPLTLARYPALLEQYPNLYISWGAAARAPRPAPRTPHPRVFLPE